MDLAEFHRQLRSYLRANGKSQKELAHAMGLHPDVLSHKLKGATNYFLTHENVKQILNLLAQWEILTFKSQVLELLHLMDLPESCFSPKEWQKLPLSRLEASGHSWVSAESNPFKSPITNANGFKPVLTRGDLPAQLTSFIGRKFEIEQLGDLLKNPTTRLINLTGPGGIGKTRLALEVASRYSKSFPDGVYFVPLEALEDASRLAEWIIQSLRLKQLDHINSLISLSRYLKNKRLLLVLDNFEHLAGAALDLATLLSSAAWLKLLITSRVVLNLYGETQVVVSPLDLPILVEEISPRLEGLAGSSAFRLFCERARAVNPFFQPNEENAWAIAKLCIHLEGLPLALELAAAHSKLFSPVALLTRLTAVPDQESASTELTSVSPDDLSGNIGQGRFGLKVRKLPGLAARHQTLRQTLDWSFNLLNPEEKILLVRLAVFSGSFTVEAVEAICLNPPVARLSSAPLAGQDLANQPNNELNLTHLLSLVNQSLVQFLPSPQEHRFVLLATVREYLQKRLKELVEFEILQEESAAFYLQLVEKAELELQKGDQYWLNRLRAEQPNLWAILNWTNLNLGRSGLQLKLVSGLIRFWQLEGQLSVGRARLIKALKQAETANDAKKRLTESLPYAKTLGGAGLLASLQGDFAVARNLNERSVTLMQQLDNKPGLANSYNNLAVQSWRQRDYGEFEKWLKLSMAIVEEIHDEVGLGVGLNSLAMLAMVKEDYQQAETFFQRSLAIRKVLGDKVGQGVSLNNLGILAKMQGDFNRAEELYTGSLGLRRELGDLGGTGAVLTNLGTLSLARGNYSQAEILLRESLALGRKLEDTIKIILNLNNLALAACFQQKFGETLEFYRESLHLTWQQSDLQSLAQILIGLCKLKCEEGHPAQAFHFGVLAEGLVMVKSFNKELNSTNLEIFQICIDYLNKLLDAAVISKIRTEMSSLTFEQIIQFCLEKVSG